MDVVDEGGLLDSKSLVEHLEEAPQKIFDVLTATSKNYLTHMIAPNCSDEKFREYCKESEVIAEGILKNMAE